MARPKRSRIRNKAQVDDRLSKGRGDIGVKNPDDYEPFLYIHDFSSMGRSSRTKHGNRVVHTMSDLETRCLNQLRWNPNVVEIFEQVALKREETLEIARLMDVRHPDLAEDGEPYVMSTDLVADISVRGYVHRHAIAIKPISAIDLTRYNRGELTDKRKRAKIENTIMKLEIERRYWERRGAIWLLVTEAVLSRVRDFNITVFLSAAKLSPRPDHKNHWSNVAYHVVRAIKNFPNRQLRLIADDLHREIGISGADFTEMLRHLCAKRQIKFDMDILFSPECHGHDFTFPTRSPDFDSWGAAA